MRQRIDGRDLRGWPRNRITAAATASIDCNHKILLHVIETDRKAEVDPRPRAVTGHATLSLDRRHNTEFFGQHAFIDAEMQVYLFLRNCLD